MAIRKRKGTGVFEEADLTQKREEAPGQVSPSVSSLTAAGAEPKQAEQALKAKTPILREAVAKEETLAGAQRLKGSEEEVSADTLAAQQKAENLQALGSLGSRVQNRVIDTFSEIKKGATQATVDEDLIKTLDLSADTAVVTKSVENLITALGETTEIDETERDDLVAGWKLANPDAGEPTDEQLLAQQQQHNIEQALVDLSNKGLSYQDALKTIKMGADQIGMSAADLVIDHDDFTIDLMFEDDDLEATGFQSFSDMAAAMGVPEDDLRGLTLPEFQQRVEDLRQAEFSNMSNIQSQLAATPPGSAQYGILVDQMRALGMVGESGIEADMSQLQEQIDSADVLQVGDTAMTVEDLLKDEAISDIVDELLDLDPNNSQDLARIEEIQEVYGTEFTDWVSSQEAALSDLANRSKLQVNEFGDVQTQWGNLGTFADGVVLDKDQMAALGIDYDPDTPVTAATTWKTKQQIENSSVYQAMNLDFGELESTFGDIFGELGITSSNWKQTLTDLSTKFTKDNLTQIKDWSSEEILSSHLASKEMQTSPDSNLLNDFVGNVGDFPDSATVEKVKKSSTIIKSVPSEIKVDLTNSPEWKQLVLDDLENGTELYKQVTVETFESAEKFATEIKSLQELPSDRDTIFNELLGTDWSEDQLEDLEARAKWDEDAADQYNDFLETYGVEAGGSHEDIDFEAIKEDMLAGYDGIDFTSVLTGGSAKSTFDSASYDKDLSYTSEDENKEFLYQSIRDDNELSLAELKDPRVEDKRALVEIYDDLDGVDAAPLYEYLAEKDLEEATDSRELTKLGAGTMEQFVADYSDEDFTKTGGSFSDEQISGAIEFIDSHLSKFPDLLSGKNSTESGVISAQETALTNLKSSLISAQTQRAEDKREADAAATKKKLLDAASDADRNIENMETAWDKDTQQALKLGIADMKDIDPNDLDKYHTNFSGALRHIKTLLNTEDLPRTAAKKYKKKIKTLQRLVNTMDAKKEINDILSTEKSTADLAALTSGADTGAITTYQNEINDMVSQLEDGMPDTTSGDMQYKAEIKRLKKLSELLGNTVTKRKDDATTKAQEQKELEALAAEQAEAAKGYGGFY